MWNIFNRDALVFISFSIHTFTYTTAMFYKLWQTRTLRLHPQSFGRKLGEELQRTLELEVLQKEIQRRGYCVCILQVNSGGARGKIQEGTGYAIFQVKFQALMFRPFVNEVIDAKVARCNHLGIVAHAGPFQIFVSRLQMFDDGEPDFDAARESWMSPDKLSEIKEGSKVRVQLITVDREEGRWSTVGKMAGDFLGSIEDEED